jgi:hypothetical protein
MLSTSEQRYKDASAAAIYTGLAAQTLAKLRCHGGGPPYIKAGRRVVYRVDDLDAWMNARRRANTSEYPRSASAPASGAA